MSGVPDERLTDRVPGSRRQTEPLILTGFRS
jgi:hypothetical protein